MTKLADIFRFSSGGMPVSMPVIDKDSVGVTDIWICTAPSEGCGKKMFAMGGETGSWEKEVMSRM